jgi:hypothetical protein
MEELLSFLIISILVLYIIRALSRIFLPMLFQNVVNKAQQQQQQQQQNYQQNYRQNTSQNTNQNTTQGKIKVDYVPPQVKKGTIPDSEGDFVDYEEIK